MDMLLLDSEGEVPYYSSQSFPDGEYWMALGAEVSSLPAEAAGWRTIPVWDRVHANLSEKLARERQFAVLPDYFSVNSPWDALIPVDAPSSLQIEWYNRIQFDECVLEDEEGFFLPANDVNRYEESQKDIWALAEAVLRQPNYCRGAPPPIMHNFSSLRKPFPRALEVQVEVATAKRQVLQQLAFVRWWCLVDPSFPDSLPALQRIFFNILDLPVYGYRGVIVDLPRDWKAINLPFWLKHKVGIWYPWGEREDRDDRFIGLSPQVLEEYHTGEATQPLEFRGTPFLTRHSYELSRALLNWRVYDWFLQPSKAIFLGITDPDDPLLTSYSHYIIDFWGWRRRFILDPDLQRLYRLLYHYRMDVVEGKTLIIYWRWRPRSNPSALILQQQEDLSTIRERFRGAHAPRPGQIFDPETGVGRTFPTKGLGAWVRAEATIEEEGRVYGRAYRQMATASIASPAPSRQSSPGASTIRSTSSFREQAQRYHSPTPTANPLLDRISSLPNSPASVVRQLRRSSPYRRSDSPSESARNERRGQSSHPPSSVGSSTSSVRSTSPPRSLESSLHSWGSAAYAMQRRPLELRITPADEVVAQMDDHEDLRVFWAHRFAEEHQKLTYFGGAWTLDKSALQWSELLLQRGYLVVGPKEQVRMRYWANCAAPEDMSSIRDVLFLAVERRLKFNIGIKASDFEDFRASSELGEAERANGWAKYSADFLETELVWDGETRFRDRYIGIVVAILERDHAGAFIAMGGVLAWIAWRFGGLSVVQKCLTGPSAQTTHHLSGASDSKDADTLYLQFDKVSAAEVDRLLGRVASSSNPDAESTLYPSTAVLEQEFDLYDGEWSPACDEVMVTITDALMNGEAVLRTKRKWHRFLRTRNYKTDEERALHLTTKNDWMAAKDALTAAFGTDWNKSRLEDITVPELFVPTPALEAELREARARRRSEDAATD